MCSSPDVLRLDPEDTRPVLKPCDTRELTDRAGGRKTDTNMKKDTSVKKFMFLCV